MTQYIIRRILLMLPTLAGVSLLVTAFVRLLPGDAVDILTANNEFQGRDQVLKKTIDAGLVKQGKDPATAGFADRKPIETALVNEQLKRDGRDPATATEAQREEAKNTFARNAYKVTNEDVAAAKAAGVAEDAIFELAVCASLGQSTRQLDTAMAALDAATKEIA